jgi:FixJ family two-component response regulator
LKVVAEGIETEAQLAMLVAEQCETVQGYFVSKPLAAEAATQFLASRWTIAPHLLTRPRGDRTLLLIDDEESILQALIRQLRREGYRILSGRSGAEGLEILAKNDVDVVVSDQRMPGMTGEDFLRRVKELYPDTVSMVLSGYADMDSITNSINQGAIFKFICKPWDDKTLKDVIQEAFQRKELNDARLRRATEIAAANVRLQESNQSLSLMLAEQSQSTLKSQTALLLAQENLDKLPVPVMGLDTSGRVVLRNEAIGAVSLTAQAVSSLIDQFPANQDRDPFQLFYRESEGTCWRIVARHLTLEEQHLGTVLAFIEVEP